MKKFILTFLAVLYTIGISFAQNDGYDSDQSSEIDNSSKSLIEVANQNEQFSTLVAAIKAADLVDNLKADGPFTIFAPDNAAFEKLSEYTLESLLKPENKSKLQSILTYHVIPEKYLLKDMLEAFKIKGGTIELTSLNGQRLRVRKGTDGYYLKDEQNKYSKIITTDIEGKNGVIHVISKVILPK